MNSSSRRTLTPQRVPYKIWLIDEGHAGHRVQAEGILRALGSLGVQLDIATIRCEPNLRGFLRPAAKAIFHYLRGVSALRFASRIAQFSVPDDGLPRFIISSGGRTAFVSRALSLSTGAPNVFVGNLGRFPPQWFTVVMSPVDLKIPQSIVTGIVPNTMTPSECRDQSLIYWNNHVPKRCWTLLIGGANRNHPYNDQDWKDIAAGVNTLAQKFDIKWLITTSRRTGAHVEQLLEAAIAPNAVEELVLFSRAPKKVVMPFLGTAEIVFVTQDSLTMLGEAVASGRPVVSLLPRTTRSFANSYGDKVLHNYHQLPQLSTLRCSEMYNYLPYTDLSKTYEDSMELIKISAKALAAHLNIDHPAIE
ncbi:MAG TPA: ELM1/GtrOC1 family putative glycosyltransferase [Hyphomicrobiales bacterium]|jgi:mitochondrial fission protein ELM1